MLKRRSEGLPLEVIKAGIVAAKGVKVDETGSPENGLWKWWHKASTAALRYQFGHQKRGPAARQDEPCVRPECKGGAVPDGGESYFGFGELKQALCEAQRLRELTGRIENSASKWGQDRKDLRGEREVKSN